jgi:hypothetical protein
MNHCPVSVYKVFQTEWAAPAIQSVYASGHRVPDSAQVTAAISVSRRHPVRVSSSLSVSVSRGVSQYEPRSPRCPRGGALRRDGAEERLHSSPSQGTGVSRHSKPSKGGPRT